MQHSDIGGCNEGGAWLPYGCGDDGGGNIDVDPLFVDPEGGDFSLLPTSPCIDAGNNVYLPDDINDLDGDGVTAEPLPRDFIGAPRAIGPAVDMGAFEFIP